MNGRYAYDGLDRLLHEKARLGLLTCLASRPEGLLFNDLKELCNLTDGNLSRHLQVLQQNQIVEIYKSFEQKRPQTLVRISAEGQERFLAYIGELQKVLIDAATTNQQQQTNSPNLPPGWVPA
ncbi:transcriptional regulator [bacterium]|nr:transcriptional regulator [bacterium]